MNEMQRMREESSAITNDENDGEEGEDSSDEYTDSDSSGESDESENSADESDASDETEASDDDDGSDEEDNDFDEKDEMETKSISTEKKIPDAANDPESILCKSSPAFQELSLPQKRGSSLSSSPKGTILPSSSIPIDSQLQDQTLSSESASSSSTKKASSSSGSSGSSITVLPQPQQQQLPPSPSQSSSSSSTTAGAVTAQVTLTQSSSSSVNASLTSQKSNVSKQADTNRLTASSNGNGRKSISRSSSVPPGTEQPANGPTKKTQKQVDIPEPTKVPEDPDLPKPGGPCAHILEQLLNEKPIFRETIKCSPEEVFRRFLTGKSTFYSDVYEEYKYTGIQSTPWVDVEKGNCGCKTREWSFHMIMSHKLAGNKPTTMRHVQTCTMNTNGTLLLQQVSYMGKEVPYGDSFRPHALLRIEPKNEDGRISSEVTVVIKIVFLRSLMFRALIEKSAYGEMSEFFINLTKKMKAHVEADATAPGRTQGRSRKERKKEGKTTSKDKKKTKRSKKGSNDEEGNDSSRVNTTRSSNVEVAREDNIGAGGNADDIKNIANTTLAIIVKALLMPLQLPVIFQGAIISVIISFVISNFVLYPVKAKLNEQSLQIQLLSDNVALLKSYCTPSMQQQQFLSSAQSPYYRTQQMQHQEYGLYQSQDPMYGGTCFVDANGNEIDNMENMNGVDMETYNINKNGGMEEVLNKLTQMNDLISLLAKNMKVDESIKSTEKVVDIEKESTLVNHHILYSTVGLILSILILVIMKCYVL